MATVPRHLPFVRSTTTNTTEGFIYSSTSPPTEEKNSTTCTNSQEFSDLIVQLNNEAVNKLIPTFCYVTFLMLVGLVGNITVCYFYGCKTRRSTTSMFIVILATFDLMTCTLAMPAEIFDLSYPILFQNALLCKFMAFINSFASYGSACTLLAISVDRYRGICKQKQGLSAYRHALIAGGSAMGLAVLMSWPTFILYNINLVNVTSSTGTILTGCDCSLTTDKGYIYYIYAFTGVQIIVFVSTGVSMTTMYTFILVKIIKYSRYWNDKGNSDSEKQGSNRENRKSVYSLPDIIGGFYSGIERRDSRVENRRGSRHMSNTSAQSNYSTRFTLTMCLVTSSFMLSFVPYFGVEIWRSTSDRERDVEMSPWLQIALRSYLLSSVLNPVIYGMLNPKFRNFFCCCLAKSSRKTVLERT